MTTYSVRVNMVDAFSQATHSIEKDITGDKLKDLEHVKMTGGIIRQHENGITYLWQIEEIEILDTKPKLFQNGIQ